jgi:hypothetical protein
MALFLSLLPLPLDPSEAILMERMKPGRNASSQLDGWRVVRANGARNHSFAAIGGDAAKGCQATEAALSRLESVEITRHNPDAPITI